MPFIGAVAVSWPPALISAPGSTRRSVTTPSEGRDDLRIRDHRGKFVGLSLRLLEVAIRDVDVLARNQPRVTFPDPLQPFVGELLDLQIGACAIQALT